MIAIIDYGMGNVGSIANMLKKIGASAVITGNLNEIKSADKYILPGVGSFDFGMNKLNMSGISEILREETTIFKKPLLGICLGMQMLGKGSEEGNEEGLGLISFYNRRFQFSNIDGLKIPHMGWYTTKIESTNDALVAELETVQRYYYVHSYHAICDDEKDVLMSSEYGYKFTAAVRNSLIYGVQFHPEKSHKYGMTLLENFALRI